MNDKVILVDENLNVLSWKGEIVGFEPSQLIHEANIFAKDSFLISLLLRMHPKYLIVNAKLIEDPKGLKKMVNNLVYGDRELNVDVVRDDDILIFYSKHGKNPNCHFSLADDLCEKNT